MSKIELLSPAGDFESLKMAVLFGADAVYIGSTMFGMRASPKNFSDIELPAAVEFAHSHGCKVYLTCNTIPTNSEVDSFPSFIQAVDTAGVDAVIIADLGLMELTKLHAPRLDIHMSTQVGVMNYANAEALYNLGAKRIVLARELSLEAIKQIRLKIPRELELEAFVHGAMCVSFSGRCLLSNYLTNRDANRGECAQPCRWNYSLMEETRPGEYFKVFESEQGSFILNSKDLCMVEHLDKMADAGINSFKIEGRAKSAYYTGVITNAYRAALNCLETSGGTLDWITKEVNAVSHREYSTGFYFNERGQQSLMNGGYIRDYDFVGLVDESRGEELFITQRNYFKLTDEIEIVSPMSAPVKIKIRKMLNSKGIETKVANIAREKMVLFLEEVATFPQNSLIRKLN
ncbi:MAG: U32 family peptidase [Oscillospiraceae bacterium]|nr:U32 family peptidase [Oscillospiraceae bacterium]